MALWELYTQPPLSNGPHVALEPTTPPAPVPVTSSDLLGLAWPTSRITHVLCQNGYKVRCWRLIPVGQHLAAPHPLPEPSLSL